MLYDSVTQMVSFSISCEVIVLFLIIYIPILFTYGYNAPFIWIKKPIMWTKCKMTHREEKVDFK